MDIYAIDESTQLFDGPKVLMDISYRDLNPCHLLVPKEFFDDGLTQISLYRSNMVLAGYSADVVDPHVASIENSPKLEMFMDAYGNIRIGNIVGHNVDTLLGSNEGVNSLTNIKEIINYAATVTGICANLPGAIYSPADCVTLLDKSVELLAKWGPKHLQYVPELDDLDYDEIPATKKRADYLRIEAATNDERWWRYFKGWDDDSVYTTIAMTVNTSFKLAVDTEFNDNETQDILYGEGTNYASINHSIAQADPRPDWAEDVYDTYVTHIENVLKKFNPTVYSALDSATIKSTLLATQTPTCKGLLYLGDVYLVGRPAGLNGISYKASIFDVSQKLDVSDDVVIEITNDEWYILVDPMMFSGILDDVAGKLADGEQKDTVLAQKALLDNLPGGIKCTLLESAEYLSQDFGASGAYAGLINSGGATLGDYDTIPGSKYADIVGGRSVDGYVTYDPGDVMVDRIFTSHIDIAKAKPWKYVAMPSENTELDGMWTTTVYKLFHLPLAGSDATTQSVADLTSEEVQSLIAAGVAVIPLSAMGANFDPTASDAGASALTATSGMTMSVLIDGLTDSDDKGITFADQHIYDKSNLTDNGFVVLSKLSGVDRNKVDIAYHGMDQSPFIKVAIYAFAAAPSKTTLIPA